jgi:hypothetical protein
MDSGERVRFQEVEGFPKVVPKRLCPEMEENTMNKAQGREMMAPDTRNR